MIDKETAARFWSKVKKTRDGWFYTGAKDGAGYGMFTLGGKKERAHRVAYMLTKGAIPKGKQILHQCVHPKNCVTPKELLAGTQQQNQADKFLRGRSCHGEKNGNVKLTEAQVKSMRRERAAGATYPALAKAYEVHRQHASRICRALYWGRVPAV